MFEDVVPHGALGGHYFESMTGVGEFEGQNTDDLLADPFLDGVRDAVGRRGCPDVLNTADVMPPRLVRVAGHDEAKVADGEGGEKSAACRRRHVANVRLG